MPSLTSLWPCLAFALLSAGCARPAVHTLAQRGTVDTPRAPYFDGQAVDSRARIELHGGTTVASALERDAMIARDVDGAPASAAAVALDRTGGSARFPVARGVDLGFELDAVWSPTARGVDGQPIAAPDRLGGTVAGTLRVARPLTDHLGVGVGVDLGFAVVPVAYRDTMATGGPVHAPGVEHAGAVLARCAVVPSYHRRGVTLFGSTGLTTETEVPPVTTWVDDPYDDTADPQVEAAAGGPALTLAVGASVEPRHGTRLTARVGDTYAAHLPAGHHGAQVDLALAFDVE